MVATIGAFDGVHRGHIALVGSVVQQARRRDASSVVVTFDPHPEAVLRRMPPPLLCDPQERDERLADLGVDHLVIEPFDEDLAAQTAELFVDRLTSDRRLEALVMTAASAFGRRRGGTLAAMQEFGSSQGFEVVEVPQVRIGGDVVSSSRIRAEIGAARLRSAARLLGRRPAVTGTVVHGDGRGRTLGFPTANLAFAGPVALPPDGIYAVRVGIGGDLVRPDRCLDGVASLGVRPTFGVGGHVLEVYLLDLDEDLYDARMRVAFVRRQRGERRFASAEALVRQMRDDVSRARGVLARSGA